MNEFYQEVDPPDIGSYHIPPFPKDESTLDYLNSLYKTNSILRYQGDASDYMRPDFRESVPEHTFHVQQTAFVLLHQYPELREAVDELEMHRYIMFHDIGEGGFDGKDWTITDVINGKIGTNNKNQAEKDYVEKITALLNPSLRDTIRYYHDGFEKCLENGILDALVARYMDAAQGVTTAYMHADTSHDSYKQACIYVLNERLTPIAAAISSCLELLPLDADDPNFALNDFKELHQSILTFLPDSD